MWCRTDFFPLRTRTNNTRKVSIAYLEQNIQHNGVMSAGKSSFFISWPSQLVGMPSCFGSMPAAGVDAPACSQHWSKDDDGMVIQVMGTTIFHNCAGDQSAFL